MQNNVHSLSKLTFAISALIFKFKSHCIKRCVYENNKIDFLKPMKLLSKVAMCDRKYS